MLRLLPLTAPGLSDALGHHPFAALGILFGAGLATSLTPCIYPMIPITVGVITASARATGAAPTRRRTVTLTLTYVSGLALAYALLGVLAGLTGSLFGSVSSNPWVLFGMANLLLVLALAMLDVIPVAAPERLARWAGTLSGGSLPAVFVLGATSGIVAAPCGAPAFAVVLTWVASTGSGALGFLYLFVFSLGMSAVLIAAGVSSGVLAALPRAGIWTSWIKRAAGVAMVAMAEYYLIQMGKVM
jgi:thiol:disulfide interchange protein DsbD